MSEYMCVTLEGGKCRLCTVVREAPGSHSAFQAGTSGAGLQGAPVEAAPPAPPCSAPVLVPASPSYPLSSSSAKWP